MGALRRLVTPCDVALGIAVLLAGLLSLYWIGQAVAGGAGTLLVELDGRPALEVTYHPSDPPRLLTVEAPRGEIAIELRDGRARVMPLPVHVCPLGICWNSGWTSHPSKVIVCLPNRLVVRLVTKDTQVDGITR